MFGTKFLKHIPQIRSKSHCQCQLNTWFHMHTKAPPALTRVPQKSQPGLFHFDFDLFHREGWRSKPFYLDSLNVKVNQVHITDFPFTILLSKIKWKKKRSRKFSRGIKASFSFSCSYRLEWSRRHENGWNTVHPIFICSRACDVIASRRVTFFVPWDCFCFVQAFLPFPLKSWHPYLEGGCKYNTLLRFTCFFDLQWKQL